MAASIPFVILFVVLATRRIHRTIHKATGQPH
jgi:hypothetical protein